MRVDTLPSPGLLSMGINLRTTAAKAISSVEINAGLSVNAGKSSSAKPLGDFFTACIAAISDMYDVVVPTPSARNVLDAMPSKLFILFSEELDKKYVPLTTDFAIAGVTKVISKVEIDGPYVVLTVTVPWVNGDVSTVAYTAGAAGNKLRDLSGNLVATFTAAAIVNSVV